jgi:hypothetical protein
MTKKQDLVNFYDLISNDEEKQKIAAAMRADTHLDAFLVVVERKKKSPRMLYVIISILYVTVRRFIRIQSIPCNQIRDKVSRRTIKQTKRMIFFCVLLLFLFVC